MVNVGDILKRVGTDDWAKNTPQYGELFKVTAVGSLIRTKSLNRDLSWTTDESSLKYLWEIHPATIEYPEDGDWE